MEELGLRLRVAASQTSGFELLVALAVLVAVGPTLFSLFRVQPTSFVLFHLARASTFSEILTTRCTSATRLTFHGIGRTVAHTRCFASCFLLALVLLFLLFIVDLLDQLLNWLRNGWCGWTHTLGDWLGLATLSTVELIIMA